MSEINTTTSMIEVTYKPHEYYLQFAASTWLTDSISLFIMPIIVILGLITNLLGFFILHFKQEFNLNIYFYLKVYFLNGFVTNSFGVLFVFCNARRYLGFSNSWVSMMYLNQIGSPAVNTCYFYNNMIDIMLTLDKLTIFIKSLSVFKNKYLKNPLIVSVVLCAYCVIVNLPIFFTAIPDTWIVKLSPNETYIFYDYRITDFNQTPTGIVFSFIDYVLRDILPFVIIVILNVLLIVLLKRYMNKRKSLTGNSRKRSVTKSTALSENTSKSAATSASSNVKDSQAAAAKKSEINAAIMVVTICCISFMKNTLIITSIVMAFIQISIISNTIGNFAYYLIFLASTLNFFIVYLGDKKFKSACKNLVKFN